MSFSKLKASDGCVIFFPSRPPEGKHPRVISGAQGTRRGWREEWVQVRLDLVTLEVRLEGEAAVDLGNDLRCEVVAKVIARVDEVDLPNALQKTVDSLRCSTTTNPKAILTESFFHDRLYPKFRATVEHVISGADYLKLLEEPSHRGKLQASFADEAKVFLGECGFALVSSEIRFRPLNPGILGAEQAISEKWIEQERAQAVLEARKTAILEDIEDKKKKESAERAARVEQELKALEISQKEAERDYSKKLHQLAIQMQADEDEKERTLAEARRALDEYFNKRQEEKDAYEHEREVERIKNEDQLEKLRTTAKREEERAELEHKRHIQEQAFVGVKQDLDIESARLDIARLTSEQATVRGLAEARVTESRVKAENVLRYEESAVTARSLERLIDRLPEVVSKLSLDDGADRTIIHFGKDVQPEMLGGTGSVIALTFLPILKQVMARLSNYLATPPSERRQQPGAPPEETPTQSPDEENGHSGDAEKPDSILDADTDAKQLHASDGASRRC